MGRPRILDQNIMSKVAKKLGRERLYDVNVMVSKKAAKLGISPEAALILIAKEHRIGTAAYQRNLPVLQQAEVRDSLSAVPASTRIKSHANNKKSKGNSKPTISGKTSLKLTIKSLIEDQEMLSRCQDILMASANYDRPISQATLVLEDRIRKKAQPTQRLVGENLVCYAFNEDPSKTVLRVASNDPDDQRGFTQILRGIMASFRNKTHHHIVNSFSREESMRVCGFIDVLLRVVDNSIKVK